jgi:hypothetical protein
MRKEQESWRERERDRVSWREKVGEAEEKRSKALQRI